MPSIRKEKKRLKRQIRKLEAEMATLDESLQSVIKHIANEWSIAFLENEIGLLNFKRKHKLF